jgi:adenosylmethionine-8-amino-7-oxononanoate aminotransferase
VTPDVMTFAKAITSGYLPLGGVVIGPRLRGWLEADDDYLLTHGGTYAGHPTCCAAGIANLEILRSEDLPERARHAGSRLRAGLDRRMDRSGVAEVRGEGLMQAVALEPPLTAGAMVAALLTRGIIARGLPYANSIAFSPPLVISDGEIDEIVDGVDAALADVAAVV